MNKKWGQKSKRLIVSLDKCGKLLIALKIRGRDSNMQNIIIIM